MEPTTALQARHDLPLLPATKSPRAFVLKGDSFEICLDDGRFALFYFRDEAPNKRGDCVMMNDTGLSLMTRQDFESSYRLLCAGYKALIQQAGYSQQEEEAIDKWIASLEEKFGYMNEETAMVFFGPDKDEHTLNMPTTLFLPRDPHDTGSYMICLDELRVLKNHDTLQPLLVDLPVTKKEFEKVMEQLKLVLAKTEEKYQMTPVMRQFLQTKMDALFQRFESQKCRAYFADDTIILAGDSCRYFNLPEGLFVEEANVYKPLDAESCTCFCQLLQAVDHPIKAWRPFLDKDVKDRYNRSCTVGKIVPMIYSYKGSTLFMRTFEHA